MMSSGIEPATFRLVAQCLSFAQESAMLVATATELVATRVDITPNCLVTRVSEAFN
jgi:hypothetical protein